jgi:hypothetical protein
MQFQAQRVLIIEQILICGFSPRYTWSIDSLLKADVAYVQTQFYCIIGSSSDKLSISCRTDTHSMDLLYSLSDNKKMIKYRESAHIKTIRIIDMTSIATSSKIKIRFRAKTLQHDRMDT